MNLRLTVTIFCLLLQQTLFAQQESISIKFRGCKVQGDTLSVLDPESFNFGFDADLTATDTLKVTVTHATGTSARHQVRFSFRAAQDTIRTGFINEVKKDDRIVITFQLRGVEVFQKIFYIASTIYSLQKPYFFDVYFIYNEDTVAADQYILGTRMKFERHHNFKRIFFSDPREFTRNFEVFKKAYLTEFTFPTYSIYHGKVIVRFLDQEQLKQKYGYEQSVRVIDMDRNPPFDKGESKSGVRQF